jgi:hypothetical protein
MVETVTLHLCYFLPSTGPASKEALDLQIKELLDKVRVRTKFHFIGKPGS